MTERSVLVNGDPLTVADGSTIADVVSSLLGEPTPRGIAVAVDRCVIPRSEWASTVAPPGSRIEVVTATAGG
jgi:sulfur carrier protein